ncbi:MAG: TIGR01777 family oxidoreductase [Nitrospira sp.]|nr:TIGR01777 family oxidoreductase [Nitrospira sp.]MCP9464921.1 TIGR01777 family oxidoreductase [Nitrospira sp.]
MNIVIAGGTGFIGRALCASLLQGGHQVTVLTRRRGTLQGATANPRVIEWDGQREGAWESCLDGADAVINLAGAPIAESRWTEARKRELVDSRILSTRALVRAMAKQASRPSILINASGIGYYGASDDRVLDEQSPAGQGFLADLCLQWEAEAQRASQFGSRVVLLRTGMVLERDGGALPRMVFPFKLFMGGPILPGNQWVSWIHRQDHIGLIRWALETPHVTGPLNAVAPEPETMSRFCSILGLVLHRPSWLPVPRMALRFALGELESLLTTGQRVLPSKALAGGYVFQFPTLESALRAIISAK